MNHINIEEFAGGALPVQVNKAIEEVTENIQDPNTDAQKARRATITIEFRPSEARDYAQTKISMKTALAPAAPINTGLVMGKNLETGECEAYEYGNTIPGQMLMRVRDQSGELDVVDTSTGEIVKNDNVIDLRSAR